MRETAGLWRNHILIASVVLYAAAFSFLLRNKNFEPVGAIIVLVLFGLLVPGLAWFTTRRAIQLPNSVVPSSLELLILTGYIIALSIYLIGGPQWIDQHLPSFWTASLPIKAFVTLAKKLIVFVIVPFVIFRFGFGYGLRDFGIQPDGLRALVRSHLPVVLVVGGFLLAFQYFLSNGGAAFRHGNFSAWQLLLGLPLCFIWLVIEVGLVEEFFFRAVIQPRLAAAFKSEVSGVILMSLVFGLAHAPGYIFRHAGELEGLGTNPGALDAVAYSIVILAVSGIGFGVIWARTKNLFALMLIHAAGDLLPNFPDFIKTWQL